MLPRMKFLVLYGLFLYDLLQCVSAKNVVSRVPTSPLIVAPGPEDQSDAEDDLLVHGLVDGDTLCMNMADYSMLPYFGNCSKYIVCKDNKTNDIGDCNLENADECIGKGANCNIQFNYKYQACQINDDIKCLPRCEANNLTSFCYDRTCTKYVLCYYNIPVLRQCQDGLQYNAETDRCDFPEYVDCVENECPQDITPEDIIYLASKAHCNKYYICADGMPWSQECSPGLYYNSKNKTCDFKDKVDCTITALQRNIKPFSRSPPRRADIICPPTGVHFYPHKSRREAYYYCVNGNGVVLDCTPGLFFDSNTDECRESKYIGS